MLVVHHLENSQSIRILWLLEELGANYRVQHYKRQQQTSLAPSEFKKLHLIGTSPTITDNELVLPETNAIMDYIMDKFGDQGLRPDIRHPQRNQYLFWLHFAQGSIMPMLTSKLMFNRFTTKVPFVIKPIMKAVIGKANQVFLQPRLDNILILMEQTLKQNTWFSGEQFTAADIVMGYCLQVAEVRAGMDQRYPNCFRFLQQMQNRPAYQRALNKNGDFKPLAD